MNMLRSLLNSSASSGSPPTSVVNVTVPTNSSQQRDKILAEPPKPGGSKRPAKSTKHNDATFYPNIMCVICHEWVCSRNRYLHVESHLQYRPYSCSVCSYDNRKQIFISLHLQRNHNGTGEVSYRPDPQIERRAWEIAEECLEYTRRLLTGGEKTEKPSKLPILSVDESLRPKIHNALRAEKTELIEQNRQLGLVPVFPVLADHEVVCRQCDRHVLKLPYTHLEEHIRQHLSVPSYACPETDCWEQHNSRGFMIRHMKEVHSHCRGIVDLMRKPSGHLIFEEFSREAADSFPPDISVAVVHRVRQRLTHADKTVYSMGEADWLEYLKLNPPPEDTEVGWNPCLGCHIGLSLDEPEVGGEVQPCVNCYRRWFEGKTTSTRQFRARVCRLCDRKLVGTGSSWDLHALSHLNAVPFRCAGCQRFENSDSEAIEEHLRLDHPNEPVGITVMWDNPELMLHQWRSLKSQCFPELSASKPLCLPASTAPTRDSDTLLSPFCSALSLEKWQMSPRVVASRMSE